MGPLHSARPRYFGRLPYSYAFFTLQIHDTQSRSYTRPLSFASSISPDLSSQSHHPCLFIPFLCSILSFSYPSYPSHCHILAPIIHLPLYLFSSIHVIQFLTLDHPLTYLPCMSPYLFISSMSTHLLPLSISSSLSHTLPSFFFPLTCSSFLSFIPFTHSHLFIPVHISMFTV
jgi:hypothetical protein